MKKICLILVFSSIFVVSTYSLSLTLRDIKIKLISTIAHVLIKDKVVKIDLEDKSFLNVKNSSTDHIVFVNSCENADLIITNNIKNIKKDCRNKLIFVTNYSAYRKAPYSIGAFFWQKGRPVLILNKKVIRQKHIRLSKQFEKYVD